MSDYDKGQIDAYDNILEYLVIDGIDEMLMSDKEIEYIEHIARWVEVQKDAVTKG